MVNDESNKENNLIKGTNVDEIENAETSTIQNNFIQFLSKIIMLLF